MLSRALALAARRPAGACLQILPRAAAATRAQVKALGERIGQALLQSRFPADQPLVLLASDDAGKTLGSYATDWGRRPATLFVIDELPDRGAHFANVGRPRENLVPVSFYGMRQEDR
jgi:ethanolamine utilization protein EutA